MYGPRLPCFPLALGSLLATLTLSILLQIYQHPLRPHFHSLPLLDVQFPSPIPGVEAGTFYILSSSLSLSASGFLHHLLLLLLLLCSSLLSSASHTHHPKKIVESSLEQLQFFKVTILRSLQHSSTLEQQAHLSLKIANNAYPYSNPVISPLQCLHLQMGIARRFTRTMLMRSTDPSKDRQLAL